MLERVFFLPSDASALSEDIVFGRFEAISILWQIREKRLLEKIKTKKSN